MSKLLVALAVIVFAQYSEAWWNGGWSGSGPARRSWPSNGWGNGGGWHQHRRWHPFYRNYINVNANPNANGGNSTAPANPPYHRTIVANKFNAQALLNSIFSAIRANNNLNGSSFNATLQQEINTELNHVLQLVEQGIDQLNRKS